MHAELEITARQIAPLSGHVILSGHIKPWIETILAPKPFFSALETWDETESPEYDIESPVTPVCLK